MQPAIPVLLKRKDCPVIEIAKSQPEYNTLPAVVYESEPGHVYVLSRWNLGWRERLRVLFSGNVYVHCLTFGRPVQPIKMATVEPDITGMRVHA